MKQTSGEAIVLENISKFYGEILGVNKVNLTIPPGITSLVGPNGSGKTTLMNLIAGLLQPTRGRVSVCGLSPLDPERYFRIVGYATQYDGFPRGLTGWQFVHSYLRLFGFSPADTERMAWEAIDRVGLREAAPRRIAGYSKGMRQRIKLAQSIAHRPGVLILDEPLNGLDPLARAETIALFRQLGSEGSHVVISSHILHEVDLISDRVIMMSQGYVVAEGQIRGVREEIADQPMQILIRCDKPEYLASKLFQQEQVVEARLHADRAGLLIRTRNAESFYKFLNHIALNGVQIESVAPADEDAQSVYEYLIGTEESTK
ncbi:MAG: ABC transporter ATP-binding protein [Acidobacteriota bacterium]|nr:ABC transporter ATP-binding protein [Acidobacteriota bacterium]